MPEDSPPSADPPVAPPPRVRRYWPWLLLFLAVAAGVYVYRSKAAGGVDAKSSVGNKQTGKNGKGGDSEAPLPVVAARARRGDIGVYFTGLGTVVPLATVVVKTRVDGELMEVKYREGDMVQKGDLLMQIDPRPYQVQLDQAEGQLAKDQATLDNARIDLTRYQQLLTQNAIPEQQVATQKATVAQDEGVIKSDQAQIDSAKLNLTYARIIAPISGRIGLRLVDAGNIVHASDSTGLVVITQIQPISVIFTLSEDQLPAVLTKLGAGQKLVVDSYDREMKTKIAEGTLATADNEIDPTTGTIRMRADFDNKQALMLFPNQFVNARLLLQEKRGVVLLPSAAIQRTTNSTFVYLVNQDATVTVRNVNVGVTEGDDSEITSGLNAGDRVVLTGADKLQDGSKVEAQVPGEAPATPPANSGQAKQKDAKQKNAKPGNPKAGSGKTGKP